MYSTAQPCVPSAQEQVPSAAGGVLCFAGKAGPPLFPALAHLFLSPVCFTLCLSICVELQPCLLLSLGTPSPLLTNLCTSGLLNPSPLYYSQRCSRPLSSLSKAGVALVVPPLYHGSLPVLSHMISIQLHCPLCNVHPFP